MNPLKGTEETLLAALSQLREPPRSATIRYVCGQDEVLPGNEIYRWGIPPSYIPCQNVVTGVELKAGLNVLVFKVVNETDHWLGSIRFTDAASQPVKGIGVTLDPKEQAR